MKRSVLYIEPVVSEIVDSWKKCLSQFIDVSLATFNYTEFLVDLRNKHGWYFNKKNEYLNFPSEKSR